MMRGTSNARRLNGVPVSATAPVDGQSMAYNAASGLWAPGLFNRAYVSVTSAQIKNLVGNPITVVAAPGANKILIPVFSTAWYKRGAASYTNTDSAAHIVLGIGASIQFLPLLSKTQMTTSLSSRNYTVGAQANVTSTAVGQFNSDIPVAQDLSNLPLTVQTNSGATNYAAGDGTISVELIYRVVDLSVL